MESYRLNIRPLIFVVGCFAQLSCSGSGQKIASCSKTQSIILPGNSVAVALESGTLKPGWGGVLDLLENPASPENSVRQRCTVRMDYVPAENGSSPNPYRFGLWTAEHCLNWSKAKSAELYVFDPKLNKYIRFRVKIDELERFKTGIDLFSRHKPEMIKAFLANGVRPERGIIERGIPACKNDTAVLQQAQARSGIVCSTVLDLARIEGTVDASEQNRSDVQDLLRRLQESLQKGESEQYMRVNSLAPLMTTNQLNAFLSFLKNWRAKVSILTKWRGYEGFAEIIEQVRLCQPTDAIGLCSEKIRQYFEDALVEYQKLAMPGVTYPEFLKFEVNRPITETSQNLQWLLFNQSNLQRGLKFTGEISFDSNFLRRTTNFSPELPTRTLGESGPLFYGSVPVEQMIGQSDKPLVDQLIFNPKTLLFHFDRSRPETENFLLQPGDSGTVLMVGNQPIGVVSTVNSKETSGGSSVLPLPEYSDETAETAVAQQPVVGGAKSPELKCK